MMIPGTNEQKALCGGHLPDELPLIRKSTSGQALTFTTNDTNFSNRLGEYITLFSISFSLDLPLWIVPKPEAYRRGYCQYPFKLQTDP